MESNVNLNGLTYSNTANFNGAGVNYFAGGIGVGVLDPGEFKLAVNGGIKAKRLKADQGNWQTLCLSRSINCLH
ncbi:hypothetical protein [Chitinophaga pinensis]|uniref:Uncharacterized protein n=1 Tax=Chitinophaga pinensis TaxID=79329 RepID=A0A5C6LJS3_9BACT|nr:hypothetical protein [Chitinophaga pinensis]TWV94689.1 hypothetical protein FEF09_25590 [Chitinophaga pinensis]